MKLLLALLGVLAPIIGLALWWARSTERRENRELLKEIEELEDDLKLALIQENMDAVAVCNDKLMRLRRKAGVLTRRYEADNV